MPHNLTKEQLDAWKAARWKARTDLQWFCREILGYKDVNPKVHTPLTSRLQAFPRPTAAQFDENDQFINGKWVYKPIIPMDEFTRMAGKRRRLILDSRGTLKTTINAQAHTIQWIINYPDIAMAIIQSSTQKASDILLEIKKHFTANPRFRELFPEHCPKKRILDFGTAERMTTEARSATCTRKEPTVMVGSIEKGLAGYHYDVIKFSDIVEPANITGQGLEMVRRNYFLSENLLVAPQYWIDVEGTRYDANDLYGFVIEMEEKLPEESRRWEIYIRGIFEKDTKGAPRKYSPEELLLPDLKDENGKPVSIWPERFSAEDILAEYFMDPYMVSCQKFNYPKRGIGGAVIFPVDDAFPKYISLADFTQRVYTVRTTMTVDTAETNNERSNHSVICIAQWDRFGRCYIRKIYRGKWTADDLVKRIIAAALTHKPHSIKIEETSYVRGLKPSLLRYCHINGVYLGLEFIKRDNHVSKIERIQNTLESWYKSGDLRFVDDFDEETKKALLSELRDFPSAKSDDILDTIADQFQGKEWFGREEARPNPIQYKTEEYLKFIGESDAIFDAPPPAASDERWFDRTGGL